MHNRFQRTKIVLGAAGLARLAQSSVAVFGMGGVGGYVAEALARSGLGTLVLIDHDRVSITNLNRQIIALESNLGRLKVQVMQERIKQINPACQVLAYDLFYDSKTKDQIFSTHFDYVADAIDSVEEKACLIEQSLKKGIPLISALGMGNKLDPTLLAVTDIWQTHTCPLARALRAALRKRGIQESIATVFSPERPLKTEGGAVPGSTAFVPPAAGLIMASVIVRDLSKEDFK